MPDILDYNIAGIPCQIRVDDYLRVPPWRGRIDNCPSSDDYYGYTELSYTVLDRKGYEAPWLERKITSGIDDSITQLITDYYSQDD